MNMNIDSFRHAYIQLQNLIEVKHNYLYSKLQKHTAMLVMTKNESKSS